MTMRSVALLSFIKGRTTKYATCKNKQGKSFHCLAILNDEDGSVEEFAQFSRKLGELTPTEVKSLKEELQVTKIITRGGNTRNIIFLPEEGGWETLDL